MNTNPDCQPATPGINGTAPLQPDNIILDLFPDVICTLDEQGYFVYISAASKQLWGVHPSEIRGKNIIEFVIPSERDSTQSAIREAMSGNKQENYLNHCQCSEQKIIPVIWSINWSKEEHLFYCIARSGSLRHQNEITTLRQQRRLYNAYKLARIGWWEWQLETGEVTASDEIYELYGITGEKQKTFNVSYFLSLVHPEDLEFVLAKWDQVNTKDLLEYEHRLIKPSGEIIYVRQQVQCLKNRMGSVIEIYGTTKDITLSTQSKLALQASENKLKQIVESLGDGFFTVDRDWKISYWNKNIEQITGRKREDVLTKNLVDFYPEVNQPGAFSQLGIPLLENVPVHFEEFSPTLDRWIAVSAYPSAEGMSVFLKDISEIKEHQKQQHLFHQQLQLVHNNLRNVLENMSDGFFTLDSNWSITYISNNILKLMGINKEDYLNKNLHDLFPEQEYSNFYKEYKSAIKENKIVSFEEYLASLNIYLEIHAYPTNEGLSVYLKNITDRKLQEKELKISNERFHFVSMATSDIVWDWNVQSGELYVNDSITKLFGYDLSEYLSVSSLWREKLHPEDRERIFMSQALALQSNDVFLWEGTYRFFKKCGGIAYVEDRAVILRDNEGIPMRMIGAAKDVTEKRKQEKRLEFISKATSEVIWERSIDSEDVMISSEKFNDVFGYEVKEDRISRSFWINNIHPADVRLLQENHEYALENNMDFYLCEYRFKRKDGSWSYIKDRTYIMRDEQERPVSMTGAMEDITKERLSERALVESEKSYRQLFNNAPLPTIISDAVTLQILDVNSAAVEIYGYTREEFLGINILDLHLEEEKFRLLEDAASLETTRNSIIAITNLKKDGSRMLVEVAVTTILYKGKAANLATIKDVTERIKLQDRLLQQEIDHQKLITKATIEAQEKERSGIGRELHDNVNQVITSAKLYVENISYYPEQSRHFVEKAGILLNKSIEEIRRLSRALVTPTLEDVGFKEAIIELTEFYKDLHFFDIDCSFRFREDTLSNELKLTIYRILQEAFNNTVKYASASLVNVSIHHTEYILNVEYKDNGKGFDPMTLSKGLGLSNIQNRANAYNGKIEINAATGKGCTISIKFPLDV